MVDSFQKLGVLSVTDDSTAPALTQLIQVGVEKQPPVTNEELRLQTVWSETMEKEMGVPQGYKNVAVLLIRWCDELDALNCGEEVTELEALFRRSDGYNYKTQTVELHNQKIPQQQIFSALTKFIDENDGEHNLLIVYYSGHGMHHENLGSAEFSFHASSLEKPPEIYVRPHHAVVSWNKIQSQLEDVDSDVLVILDTCFAGNLSKGTTAEDTRIFEILAAGGPNRLTDGPGPRSFTRALIDSLESLLKECGDTGHFNSWQLEHKILALATRRNNPPLVIPGNRQYNRHISLAPLRNTESERDDKFKKLDAKSFLTLRLSLKDRTLDKERVKNLVEHLSRAAKQSTVQVQSIDWLGLRYSSRLRPAVLGVTALIKLRRLIRKAVRQLASPSPRLLPSPGLTPKRLMTEEEDDLILMPDTKRQRHDTSEGVGSLAKEYTPVEFTPGMSDIEAGENVKRSIPDIVFDSVGANETYSYDPAFREVLEAMRNGNPTYFKKWVKKPWKTG